jgi:multidrug resistance efflux pump
MTGMIKKDPLKFNKIIMMLLIVFISIIGYLFLTMDNNDYIEVSGEIKPIVNQIVAPEISGIVKKIYFHDGDMINKGDLLLELNNKDLLFQLSYNKKKMDSIILKKENELKYPDLNTNELKIKEYNNEIDMLMLEIQSIEDKLNKCKVYSNFPGIIYGDNSDPKEGIYFNAGTEIQKVFYDKEIYAEVFIPENDYSKIKIDQKVKIFINAFPYTKYKAFSGKVTQKNNFKTSKYSSGYTCMVLITDPDFYTVENNKTEKKRLFFGLTLQARIYLEKKKLFERLFQ